MGRWFVAFCPLYQVRHILLLLRCWSMPSRYQLGHITHFFHHLADNAQEVSHSGQEFPCGQRVPQSLYFIQCVGRKSQGCLFPICIAGPSRLRISSLSGNVVAGASSFGVSSSTSASCCSSSAHWSGSEGLDFALRMIGFPLLVDLLPLPRAPGAPLGGCKVRQEKVAVEPAGRGAGSGDPLLRFPVLCIRSVVSSSCTSRGSSPP